MNPVVGVVLLFISLPYSLCQNISLNEIDYSKSKTGCTDGLAINDKFVFTGKLDTEGSDPNIWPLRVLFLSRENASFSFKLYCELILNVSTCSPLMFNAAKCFCESQTANVYNITINDTATLLLSSNEIRGQWSNRLSTQSRFTDIRSIPHVYDTPIGTVETDMEYILSDDLIIYAKQSYDSLKYCVGNLALKYTLKILSGETELGNSESMCLSVKIQPGWIDQYLNFSYTESSGCYRSRKYINIQIHVKPPGDSSDSTTIIIIVVSVLGSCVIIAGGGGLIYYFKVVKPRKENKRNSSHPLADTPTATPTAPTPLAPVSTARHIETKRPLPPLAHLPPHKIYPDISGNNEKASKITNTTSNETPNDSPRKKKTKRKRARKNLENGGKNDEQ